MKNRIDSIHDALDRFGQAPESWPEDASDEARDYCQALDRLEQAGLSAPEGLVGRIMAALPDRPDPCRRRRLKLLLDEWLSRPRLKPILAAGSALLILFCFIWLKGPGPAQALSPVTFDLFAPQASSVELVGTFNQWQAQTASLTGPDDVGHWSATIQLPPGRHEYMFLVNGKELVSDPDAEAFAPDGYGNLNSVVFVLAKDERDIPRTALQADTPLPLPTLPPQTRKGNGPIWSRRPGRRPRIMRPGLDLS